MTRFDRWSKDGPTPGSAEFLQIQRGIDQTMLGAIQDARNGISRSATMIPDGKRNESPRAASGGTAELKVSGINYLDAIAQGFEQRERLEALGKQLALARELAGDVKEPEVSPDPKAAKNE